MPDFRIFYDENATSKQIDAGLEQILDFLSQNPHRVNDKLGEYCDRLFVLFIFNTDKIDFVRIEKSTQIWEINFRLVDSNRIKFKDILSTLCYNLLKILKIKDEKWAKNLNFKPR